MVYQPSADRLADRPSADRLEYDAAKVGGYEDRLASIYAAIEARARAAAANAAAARAKETGNPSESPYYPNTMGGIFQDSSQGPTIFDFSDESRPEESAVEDVLGEITYDDFDAASKAAIATNKAAYYRTSSGVIRSVTPMEAQIEGLRYAKQLDYATGTTAMQRAEWSDPGLLTDEQREQRRANPGDYQGLPDRTGLPPSTRENPVPDSWPVFMGYDTAYAEGPTGAKVLQGMDPVFQDSMSVRYLSLLPRDYQVEIVDMVMTYYGGQAQNPSWIQNRWEEAVDEAAMAYAVHGVMISPLEVFDERVAAFAAADAAAAASGGGGYSGGGGGGTGGVINLTNETAARAILNQAMSAWLGRQASPEEVRQFLTLLNQQERANPVTQTQEGEYLVQSGGFEPQQFAEDYVKSIEGSGEYQAVTTYLDAFLNALGGKMGVV